MDGDNATKLAISLAEKAAAGGTITLTASSEGGQGFADFIAALAKGLENSELQHRHDKPR